MESDQDQASDDQSRLLTFCQREESESQRM